MVHGAGVLVGAFDTQSSADELAACADCLDEEVVPVAGVAVWDWTHWNADDPGAEPRPSVRVASL